MPQDNRSAFPVQWPPHLLLHQIIHGTAARPQSSLPLYRYAKLDRDSRETRLIKYKGLQQLDGVLVQCFQIRNVSLETPISYFALSYPCGDVKDLVPVIVDGRLAYIYKSLDLALRDTLPCTSESILWVDALSINQFDNDEKAYQILQLSNIYRNATRALVWVGPGVTKLQRAKDTIDSFSVVVEHWRSFFFSQDAHDEEESVSPGNEERKKQLMATHVARACSQLTPKHHDEFKQFFDMPWWRRVWVLQELALPDQVYFVCGEGMLPLTSLLNTLGLSEQICSFWPPEQYGLNVIHILSLMTASARGRNMMIRHIYRERPWASTLMRLVGYTCIAKDQGQLSDKGLRQDETMLLATDPRDRVYAMLSFAKDRNELRIMPNYTKTYQDVYIEVAKAILSNGEYAILSLRNNDRDNRGLPSWVPDWTLPIIEPINYEFTGEEWQESFHATRHCERGAIKFDGSICSVDAFLVDTIVGVTSTFDSTLVSHSMEVNIQCMENFRIWLLEFLKMHDNIIGFEDKSKETLGKLGSSVVVGQIWELATSSHRCADVDECAVAMEKIISRTNKLTGLSVMDPVTAVFQHQALPRCFGRRLFITESGYIGLGPGRTEKQDQIYLIPNATVPFMLKRSGEFETPDHFELLGEAYVYGIMLGEFLQQDRPVKTIHLI